MSSPKGVQIGRVVHYVDYEGITHHAAIITGLEDCEDDDVCLVFFNDGNETVEFLHGVPYDGTEIPFPGTWHFPEYVP